MSKKIGGVVGLGAMCALSLFLLNCGSSSSRPSGLLYVLTQGINGGGDNVSSFAINLGSGNLSLINSNAQTCATANGCGLPLDILLDPTASVAFVLNQGSPCTPTPPTCTPTGSIPPTINAYKVGGDGSLSAPSTAATLTAGDTAIAMKRDAAGNFLFVITAFPQLLVYSMQPGSTSLTQVTSLTLTKAPTDLSVITFTPAGSSSVQEFLYVTNNFDYCTGITCNPQHNDNTVSAYTVGSTGTLTEQANSPYAVAATDPISVIAVNTNPPGQNTGGVFVYVGNQDPNGGHVYPFQVCTVLGNNGCTQSDVQTSLMVPLATCPQTSCDVPPTNAGQQPVTMLVDPTNNFLYVLSEGSNTLYGFRINTTAGTLGALTPASEPTGSQPVALALQPPVGSSAQFIYVSNSTSSNISGFNVSTTTGSMSNPITVVSPSNPSGMVAR
jgi:lactonase family protein with 7-bladed beta-propeller